jgi:hypothetical protein
MQSGTLPARQDECKGISGQAADKARIFVVLVIHKHTLQPLRAIIGQVIPKTLAGRNRHSDPKTGWRDRSPCTVLKGQLPL